MVSCSGIKCNHILTITNLVIFSIIVAVAFLSIFNTKAYAEDTDDIENVTFSIPTKIQFKIKSDGTLVAPSDWSMSVPMGQLPVTITDISATNIPDGIGLHATSEKRTLLSHNGKSTADGYFEYEYENGESTFRANGASENDPLVTAYGDKMKGKFRFNWELTGVDSNQDLFNEAADSEFSIGTVTFHVQAVKQAFAIYSDTDSSLDFYKRVRMPDVGDTFENRKVTNIYTGFETSIYDIIALGETNDNAKDDATVNTPWYGIRNEALSVNVIDNGIMPNELQNWFENFTVCESFKINKLDTHRCHSFHNLFSNCYAMTTCEVSNLDASNVQSITHMFIRCRSIESIDLSKWKTESLTVLHNVFGDCSSLTHIELGSGWNTSHCGRFTRTFEQCPKLVIDCSDWDVSSMNSGVCDEQHPTWNSFFNRGSASVILPKSWQAGIFSVYSKTDDSLCFYNRRNIELPAVGDTFNNRICTNVYTGFENSKYDFTNGSSNNHTTTNVPWFQHAHDITKIKVFDDGIKPLSLRCYFARHDRITSVDIDKFDLSRCISLSDTFFCNTSLISIDLSNIDVSNVLNYGYMFQSCVNIEKINISTWDTSSATNLFGMFYSCEKLTDLRIPDTLVTSSATSIGAIFGRCTSLVSVDASKWDTSNVSEMLGVFYNCPLLESVGDISGWDTSKVKRFSDNADGVIMGMFSGDTKLIVDCSNWDVSSATDYRDFALNAPSVILPRAWQTSTNSVLIGE